MQETKTNGMTAAVSDTIDTVKDAGRDAIEKGYEGAREYAAAGLNYAEEASDGLIEFAKRQPLIALAGAFAFGYFVATTLRKLS
jgi:hypothetical protein